MDLVAVELAVGRGAEVIFDVARAADVGGIGRAAGELVEDRGRGLTHHVGEDVEAAAVGHADVDLGDAELAAVLDHRFQSRNRAFAAIEAEALGADIFAGEEFLPLLGVDDLGQDRLLAFGRELTISACLPSIRSCRKRRSSTSLMCMYSRPTWPQ